MTFDLGTANPAPQEIESWETPSSPRWGAWSETGRLTDVLLSAPAYLKMVPCNEVTRDSLAQGLSTCSATAVKQHKEFASALGSAGVRCQFVPPHSSMADLSFTRDSALMSPWGLIELRPAASHRQAETAHVAAAARKIGVPVHGRVREGRIEGGDVCLVREGTVLIACSGERTDAVGAAALGAMFEARGWDCVTVPIDPLYLHLDTVLTMVGHRLAVIHRPAFDPEFIEWLEGLGIELIDASADEVAKLGANLVSLGERRVLAAAGRKRLNGELRDRGYQVIEVAIDQFTRCGGGPHCLTLPLARHRI